jgi:uncharacterized protein
MDFLTHVEWSPYLVGALIGVLNICALLLSDKPLGASTSYAKISGMILKVFNKEYVKKNKYFSNTKPKVDWGVMLVFGIVLGSFLSASLSGDFELVFVPSMWADVFTDSFLIRFISALFGGILLGIGSRWAGGCTSGHGISGTSQLSVISWVAAICFFIGGIITAGLIYGF